jgi:transcriptional regulator with XRE-family HTH domain
MRTLSVAEWCVEKKITVDQLTAQAEMFPDRVAAIVLGRWTPSPSERQKIAGVLGVTIDEISWGHKTPIQHIYGHGPG